MTAVLIQVVAAGSAGALQQDLDQLEDVFALGATLDDGVEQQPRVALAKRGEDTVDGSGPHPIALQSVRCAPHNPLFNPIFPLNLLTEWLNRAIYKETSAKPTGVL